MDMDNSVVIMGVGRGYKGVKWEWKNTIKNIKIKNQNQNM